MLSIFPRRLKIQNPKKNNKQSVNLAGLFLPSLTKRVVVSYNIKNSHSDHPSAAGLTAAFCCTETGYYFSSTFYFLAF